MSDIDDQLEIVKGMLVGIEITVLGIAIGGGGVLFQFWVPLIVGILLVLFGALRTAIAAV